jgi:hypothetical protein
MTAKSGGANDHARAGARRCAGAARKAARPWTAVLAEVAGDRTKAVLGFAGGAQECGRKEEALAAIWWRE